MTLSEMPVIVRPSIMRYATLGLFSGIGAAITLIAISYGLRAMGVGAAGRARTVQQARSIQTIATDHDSLKREVRERRRLLELRQP